MLSFGGSVNEVERVEAVMNSHGSPLVVYHLHCPKIPGLAAYPASKFYGELTVPYPGLSAAATALAAFSAALLNKHFWGQSPWGHCFFCISKEMPVPLEKTGGRAAR